MPFASFARRFACAATVIVGTMSACGARTPLLLERTDAAPIPPDAKKVCPTARAIDLARDPVYLEIVLDGSGSMSGGKWGPARAATLALIKQIASEGDPNLGLGLLVFSDDLDPTGGRGPYPSKADVPIQFVDQAQVTSCTTRLSGGPSASTPLFGAISGGMKALKAVESAPPPPLLPKGRPVIILLTDGDPTDATQAEVRDLVTSARQQGIRTFVIGVTGGDPWYLSDLAVAGGTRRTPDCGVLPKNEYCHFQIEIQSETTRELREALDAIRISAGVSCRYAIDGNLAAEDPVTVSWTDGLGVEHVVVRDVADGFHVDFATSPPTVVIDDASCDAILADKAASVVVKVDCGKG